MQEFELKVQGAYARGREGRNCGILWLIKLHKPRDFWWDDLKIIAIKRRQCAHEKKS